MSKYVYYLEDQDGDGVVGIRKSPINKAVTIFAGPILLEFKAAKDARLYAKTHFPKERLTVKALLRFRPLKATSTERQVA